MWLKRLLIRRILALMASRAAVRQNPFDGGEEPVEVAAGAGGEHDEGAQLAAHCFLAPCRQVGAGVAGSTPISLDGRCRFGRIRR